MNNYSNQFYGRRKGRGYKRFKQQMLKFNDFDFFLKPHDLNKYSSFSNNILEIGFGNAENLINISKKYSNISFIAADPYLNSCFKLCKVLTKHKLKNVKIWADDIREIIKLFPENIFDLILILHPDPWPKNKHKKRRLVQQYFIDFLARILKKNGKILLSSDENNMKSWILEQFHVRQDFEWYVKNVNICNKKPFCLVNSKYSKKAISVGNKINWFVYRKL